MNINSSTDVTTDSTVRTLPANVSAEQMLLGALLVNSNLLDQVGEILRAEHFYEQIHQKIYAAIELLVEKGLSANPITIKSLLEKDALYQEIKGGDYIIKLTVMATVVINPRDYSRIIYDNAIKRNLIAIGEEIVNSAYDATLAEEANVQIENAENRLYILASTGADEKNLIKMPEAISISLQSIDRARKNKGHLNGISTGLIDLDNKLSGFQNSDLLILAGRPSMGKTAFAVNFALHACYSLQKKATNDEQPKSVCFFSLEMSAEQLAHRLLSIMSSISSTKLRNGDIEEYHYNELRKAATELSSMPFFIDDTPAMTISALRIKARRMKRKHNIGIIFVDYLQLLRGSSKVDSRVLEVAEITRGLKAIAKELNIPVMALAQLSRAVEARADKRPLLSDLRESGSIEQDADVVMLLYREEYYNKGDAVPVPPIGSDAYSDWIANKGMVHNKAEIIVAKHRNGAVGTVTVYYNPESSAVKNASHDK